MADFQSPCMSITASYRCSLSRLRKAARSAFTDADHQALRQRRSATGMTAFKRGCRAGMAANASSATQSIRAPGMWRAISETAGSAWTRSPMDEVLTREDAGHGRKPVRNRLRGKGGF